MKQYVSNGWFHASELGRAVAAISKAATSVHLHWLSFPGTKYVQIRIDQRTGDFILLDQDGGVLPADTIHGMYPELREDV